MRHDYYSYSKEELLKSPKIELIPMEDGEDVFRSMAEEMVAEIEKNNVILPNNIFLTTNCYTVKIAQEFLK